MSTASHPVHLPLTVFSSSKGPTEHRPPAPPMGRGMSPHFLHYDGAAFSSSEALPVVSIMGDGRSRRFASHNHAERAIFYWSRN